jgi:glutamyl-tRNA synthetase
MFICSDEYIVLTEASGYLHIGHLKAAMLNDYFAHELYKGTMLLRFDDTNPSKEKQEFQDAIVEDLALIGIKPDKTSFTSDYFDTLYKYCVRIIEEGHAYADDTDQETMRDERMKGIASKNRDNSVEANLAILEEMKKGTETGKKNCIRAKMSVDNPNKAMRDPVIYRCNADISHHRTGTAWKMYPTYDFACPIVDALEGVTHALRTTEYTDRNPQYQWFLDTLKLRQVHIWDFSRMNFIRTELSKRKLTKMIETGRVWGWDDPRLPTIRGVRRRGMTISALRDFILKQGPSRNIVNMDWTNFWATNKKEIDPIAPRHTAVEPKDAVKATVVNGPANPYTEDKPKHVKNPAVGSKKVAYSKQLILDQEDVKLFKQDQEITLMNWGNAFVRKITGSGPITEIELELHLEGDVKKTEKKVTWLSTAGQELIPAEAWEFDYLITKDKLEDGDNWEDFFNPNSGSKTDVVCDSNLADLHEGDIIQLERKGYFRVDKVAKDGKPAVLFGIPTGKSK